MDQIPAERKHQVQIESSCRVTIYDPATSRTCAYWPTLGMARRAPCHIVEPTWSHVAA